MGIIDRNRLQIGGDTEEVMALENLKAKWEAFGWNAHEADGHDLQGLVDLLHNLQPGGGRPHLVIANTVKEKAYRLWRIIKAGTTECPRMKSISRL